MPSWATKKFQSPLDGGGVLDGDQIFSITIRHTPTIWWRLNFFGCQERRHVIFFGKPLMLWWPKIFGCYKIGDQNSFWVTICNEGYPNVNGKFLAFFLTYMTNMSKRTPTWRLMQNGRITLVLTTLTISLILIFVLDIINHIVGKDGCLKIDAQTTLYTSMDVISTKLNLMILWLHASFRFK
jgi:hypothetical protein